MSQQSPIERVVDLLNVDEIEEENWVHNKVQIRDRSVRAKTDQFFRK